MNYERLVFYFLKHVKSKKIGTEVIIAPQEDLPDEYFPFEDFTALLNELEEDNLLNFSVENEKYTIRLKWGFERWFFDYVERILATYIVLDTLYWIVKNNDHTSVLLNLYHLNTEKLPPNAFDLSSDSYFPAIFRLEENGVFTKVRYGVDDDNYAIGVTFDQGTFRQYRKAFNDLFDEMQASRFLNRASIDLVEEMDIEITVGINIEYSMGVIGLRISNGQKYIVSRPQVAKENDLIFEYLFNNPDKFVTKSEIENKVLKKPMKKDFDKVIENLRFKKTLRKILFKINKDMIQIHTHVSVSTETWETIKQEGFLKP